MLMPLNKSHVVMLALSAASPGRSSAKVCSAHRDRIVSQPVLCYAGTSDKGFLLEFDNETRLFVRIPYPAYGNVQRAVASEVATMTYVRELCANWDVVPKPPRVIAWDSTYYNSARTPYIIEEYVQGVPLSQRWADIAGPTAGAALASIAALESALLRRPFAENGSLYFAKDVPLHLQGRLLYPPGDTCPDELSLPSKDKYQIGPTANREWWRGDYAKVQANRGPCELRQRSVLVYRLMIRASQGLILLA